MLVQMEQLTMKYILLKLEKEISLMEDMSLECGRRCRCIKHTTADRCSLQRDKHGELMTCKCRSIQHTKSSGIMTCTVLYQRGSTITLTFTIIRKIFSFKVYMKHISHKRINYAIFIYLYYVYILNHTKYISGTHFNI